MTRLRRQLNNNVRRLETCRFFIKLVQRLSQSAVTFYRLYPAANNCMDHMFTVILTATRRNIHSELTRLMAMKVPRQEVNFPLHN